jgi:ketosteroid isomerase-like protein
MNNSSRVSDLFSAIDAKDTSGFLAFLTPDARFRFGNAPVVQGREAIGEVVGGFFASIEALEHDVGKTWSDETSIVCHGEVTYTRKDGSQLTVPFADVFGFQGDLIDEYLIHIDVSQL